MNTMTPYPNATLLPVSALSAPESVCHYEYHFLEHQVGASPPPFPSALQFFNSRTNTKNIATAPNNNGTVSLVCPMFQSITRGVQQVRVPAVLPASASRRRRNKRDNKREEHDQESEKDSTRIQVLLEGIFLSCPISSTTTTPILCTATSNTSLNDGDHLLFLAATSSSCFCQGYVVQSRQLTTADATITSTDSRSSPRSTSTSSNTICRCFPCSPTTTTKGTENISSTTSLKFSWECNQPVLVGDDSCWGWDCQGNCYNKDEEEAGEMATTTTKEDDDDYQSASWVDAALKYHVMAPPSTPGGGYLHLQWIPSPPATTASKIATIQTTVRRLPS